MSKGLANFEVPLSNDIALGECIVYGDYEKSTQMIIGATRGGVKVDFERSIKEIKSDGQYGPVKSLRRVEKFLAKVTLQSLCLKYLNKDVISDMESDGLWESQDWGQAGGTYAAETTIKTQGDQSAKATVSSSTHGIHEVFAASKDFTAFANGEVSGAGDKIAFSIYITTAEITDLGTADIRFKVHMDVEGTETNHYYYDVEASALSNGWNNFNILKSAFTEVGTGDWSAVTGISFSLNGAPSAETVFYADCVYLIQTTSPLQSSIVPVNGGGMSYTDEGAYKKMIPNLSISRNEYYENIAVVGQKEDGKVFIVILYDCLNDGAISLSLAEKDEVVNTTVFTAHYKRSSKTTVPLKIRDYEV